MKQSLAFGLLFVFASCVSDHASTQIVSQKYIHKYGFELDKAEWLDRNQDGKIEQYLENGVKIVQNYQNGSLHGTTSYTYPYSATVEKTLVYDQGQRIQETVHDRKGIPIQQKNYVNDKEQQIIYWSEHAAPLSVETYRDGLLLKGLYYNAQNELEAKIEQGEGTRYKRMRNGLLIGMDEIIAGSLYKRTSYHPNGKVHVVSYFQDYLLNGTQEIYTPEGVLYMVNQWQDGLLHGKKLSYMLGYLILATNYEHGKKEGIEKRYDPTGKLLSEVLYEQNERHGVSKHYGERNGVKKEWFYRGKCISLERFEMLTNKEEFIAPIQE